MSRRLVALAILILTGIGAAAAWAAFSSVTAPPSSSFSANTTFCVSPGTQSGTDTGDTWVGEDKDNASAATSSPLQVKGAAPKRRRAYVQFSLPALPHNCSVTSATLTLYFGIVNTADTVDVLRADGAWTETVFSWGAQPGWTGTPVSAVVSGIGSVAFSVTSQVQSLYSGSNNGFVVVDHSDYTLGTGTLDVQINSREAPSNTPQLSITFG